MEIEGSRISSCRGEGQDSSILFQLKRSSQKIENLLQEVARLRAQSDTQCQIIGNLQDKLNQTSSDRAHLEGLVEILRAELDQSNVKIVLLQSDKKQDNSEQLLRILKKRYQNCQEENVVLRRQLQKKEKSCQQLKTNNEHLEQQKIALSEQLAIMTQQLHCSEVTIQALCRKNKDLQVALAEVIERERDVIGLLSEYQGKLGMVGSRLRQSKVDEEGWFCELKDFKDTVDHIEELRQVWRLKKGIQTEII